MENTLWRTPKRNICLKTSNAPEWLVEPCNYSELLARSLGGYQTAAFQTPPQYSAPFSFWKYIDLSSGSPRRLYSINIHGNLQFFCFLSNMRSATHIDILTRWELTNYDIPPYICIISWNSTIQSCLPSYSALETITNPFFKTFPLTDTTTLEHLCAKAYNTFEDPESRSIPHDYLSPLTTEIHLISRFYKLIHDSVMYSATEFQWCCVEWGKVMFSIRPCNITFLPSLQHLVLY